MTSRALLIVGSLAVACASYQPDTLPPRLLLEPSDLSAFEIRAADLRNPLLPELVVAIADGLTATEAAVLAVTGNRDLRAARAKRGVLDAQLIEAGILPNPQLALSVDAPVGGATAGTVTGYSAELGVELAPLMGRRARIAAAKAGQASIAADIAWQEWQVALAAKAAVYDLASLEALIVLAREGETEMRADADRLDKLLANKLATSIDAAAARTALAEMTARRLELEHERGSQRLVLLELLGLSPSDAIELADDELPILAAPPSEEALFAGLEERRLDLIALRRGYLGQGETVRAATLARFPSIGVAGHLARDTAGLYSAGATLSIGLPTFDRNQGPIAEERATAAVLRDEYLARRARAAFEIAQARSDIIWLAARIAAAIEADAIVSAALEIERQALTRGLIDAHDYYTSWNAAFVKRIEMVRLRQQMARSILSLEAATGLFVLPTNESGVTQ